MKKQILLALATITFSSALFAVEPTQANTNAPLESVQQKPFFDREPPKNIAFEITLKSNTPIETIKSITNLISVEKTKQYKVHILVTEVTDEKSGSQNK